MWSTNKKDRYLRSSLLFINCAASIVIVYIYIVCTSKEYKMDVGASADELLKPEPMTDEKCIPVCDSRACVWHAHTLLRNMDSTVDPCENFDSFLCGGYKQRFSSEEKANVILEHRSPMLNKIKGVLEDIEAETDSASAKMKVVYDSCINYRSSELQGYTDFTNFLNNLGMFNWQNLPNDFNFSYSLPVVVGNLAAYGAKEYFVLSRHARNEEEYLSNSFILRFEIYNLEEDAKISRREAISILKYFDLEPANVETIIKDHQHVRESIISLYENFDKCEENCSDVHYVDCFSENDSDLHYLCETMEVFYKMVNLTDQVSTKSLPVQVSCVNFYKNLFPLLDSLSDRSLANFMVLNFIKRHQDELNFYFRLSKLKDKNFLGEDESRGYFYEVDRWKYCVTWIIKNMKMALLNEFFRNYLTRTRSQELVDLYNDYVYDLSDMVAHQKWISPETKSEIENDLKNVITFNVYPLSQVYPNDTFVNEIYEKFYPTHDSFFNNALNFRRYMSRFSLTLNLMSNLKAFIANHWTDFEVQASFLDDSLVVHYGMLLPPYYIPGHISLINRALQGLLEGHELGHYLIPKLKTIPEINDTLFDKVQCIRDQYSRFKFEILNENLNGSKYDAESIPDNVATALFDKIIEKYYSEQEDFMLPGLPYSAKQILYMSASQMFCSKSNLEEEMRHRGSVMHPPSEYRIIAIMQNSRGYSEAFYCPVGSVMNPTKKCTLLEKS